MNPYKTLVSIALTVLMLSCAMTHSLQRSTPTADIHLPGIYVHRIVHNPSPEKRIEKRTMTETKNDKAGA